MKEISIVGGGGFAREVYILATELGYKVSAFLVNKEHITHSKVYGVPVLPLESHEFKFKGSYVIAVGSPRLRKKFRDGIHLGLECFPNLIHPSVPINSHISMGRGNIICHGNFLTVDITLGNFNLINQSCTAGHDVRIENFVTVSPGVNLAGNVFLNDLVDVGAGSVLIPKIEIAKGTIIGAGSVVVKSVLIENQTVFGNPARVMWENKE